MGNRRRSEGALSGATHEGICGQNQRPDRLALRPRALARVIDESDVAAYERDGVVCLRQQLDSRWVDRLRGAIERDLAAPGPNATNFAEGSSAGKFFGDMFMWKQDPDFRDAALASTAPAIAARLMRSVAANFFYDQLFVKE